MSDYLIHYGVKGMKWGVRKQRPYSNSQRAYSQAKMRYQQEKKSYRKQQRDKVKAKFNNKKVKRVAVGAAIVGGTLLAAYGGYKVSKLRYNARNESIQRVINNSYMAKVSEINTATEHGVRYERKYGWYVDPDNRAGKLKNKFYGIDSKGQMRGDHYMSLLESRNKKSIYGKIHNR